MKSGSAVWTPSTPGNLLAWYDASVGVTQSSGNVSAWADQSGHGYTMSQLGGAPQYSATGWNSNKPTIAFPSGAILQNISAGLGQYPNGTQAISIFATASYTTGAYRALLTWRDSGASVFYRNFISIGQKMTFDVNGAQTNGPTSLSNGNYRLAYLVGGGTMTTYQNNTLDMSGVAFTPALSGLTELLIGCVQDGTLPWVNNVSEIAIYSAKLTATDVGNYQSYSAAKWGG